MPISPAEAKKKRAARNSLAYQLACGQVDKSLSEDGPNQGNEHWVACSLVPDGYHAQFVQDYINAGWSLRTVSDQRDGDAFVLSPGRKGR